MQTSQLKHLDTVQYTVKQWHPFHVSKFNAYNQKQLVTDNRSVYHDRWCKTVSSNIARRYNTILTSFWIRVSKFSRGTGQGNEKVTVLGLGWITAEWLSQSCMHELSVVCLTYLGPGFACLAVLPWPLFLLLYSVLKTHFLISFPLPFVVVFCP